MPLLSITTNVTTDSQSELLGNASAAVASMLGKPERYVMVKLQHNPNMLFDGTNAPLAYLELKSIGLPEAKTAELSQALSQLIQTALGVENDRIYIEFANAERHMWGWNGATF